MLHELCFNNFFYDFKSIPKEINPELIVLSTTTKTHYKIFLKIFKHKFKNLKVILAEKPFCNTIEQANKIRYLSKKNNVKIFINYTRNYYKSFNIINKYFDKKKSNEGTVYYSGDFKNNASHFISLFSKFYGKINNIHILESKYIQTDFKTIVSNEHDETTNEPKFKISKSLLTS
jgi:predicted dehydrogenase